MWKGRLLALVRLLGSCLHRVRQTGSWKAQLQAPGKLRASRLNRMGRLQARGKLQASLQGMKMVSRIDLLGRPPDTLQGTRAMCRADWRERLHVSLVMTRMADQRVKPRVTPRERMAAMLKLRKAQRGSACCEPESLAHACAYFAEG